MRSVEAREPAHAVRILLDPDDRENDQGEQHHHAEEVLDEGHPGPLIDDRDGEVRVDERAVGLQDRQAQDDEAPEGEEVRQARESSTSAACAGPAPRRLRPRLPCAGPENARADAADPSGTAETA